MANHQSKNELLRRIKELEAENALLRSDAKLPRNTVKVPENMKPLFSKSEKIVGDYFANLKMDPSRGTISVGNERYVLVRASALSHDFLTTMAKLYADRGVKEAMAIGKNFLFDISHLIGMNDAKSFHHKMGLQEAIEKMSAGPVHFAYSGWAYVDIHPDSAPSPDENFYLLYNHPFSFEADSWIRSGRKSETPVCIMNAGYSSGWCEESFGLPLTAVEVTCKAKGDKDCTFIMSPPGRIQSHLEKFAREVPATLRKKINYDIPTFFERKKVEEEMQNARAKAEESDRAKSEFLANMSHEIRTPLNAILGYVDLMLQDEISTDHRSYLETLRESGRLLLNLISDILDLSKIEAGQLMIEESECVIAELLDSVEVTARGLLSQNGTSTLVRLEKSVAPELSHSILVDPLRLRQMLLNLISNAVKFTASGTIRFGAVLSTDKQIEFFVEDTGIGVAKKDQAKIFESFGQADTSSTREKGGSGLGLTISKKLAQLMGGQIGVHSEAGKGARFFFKLPYKPVSDRAAGKGPASNVAEAASDCILLVEDNIINQRLTRLILEKAGFRVLTAGNGKIAVEMFEAHDEIDVVIMDIQMPVLDGLAATRKIRAYEKKQKKKPRPVIALTAHALKGDKEQCLAAGCDDYLSKPIMIDVLIATIRKFV